jgi:hypothetical protein
MQKKYVLHLLSRVYHVQSGQLASLYDVPRGECVVFDHSNPDRENIRGLDMSRMFHLYILESPEDYAAAREQLKALIGVPNA